MCQSFLPIMRLEGRIVTVSSVSGHYGLFGQALRARFRDPEITLEGIEDLARKYEVSSLLTYLFIFTICVAICFFPFSPKCTMDVFQNSLPKDSAYHQTSRQKSRYQPYFSFFLFFFSFLVYAFTYSAPSC